MTPEAESIVRMVRYFAARHELAERLGDETDVAERRLAALINRAAARALRQVAKLITEGEHDADRFQPGDTDR